MSHRVMTPRHMLVLQAALRFWQDEMRPHSTDLMAGYIGDHVPEDELPDADDVAWIADNFHRSRLRYSVISLDGNQLLYDRLYVEPEAAEQAIGTAEARVGTLLLLMDDDADSGDLNAID